MTTEVKDIRPVYIKGLKEYIKHQNEGSLSDAYQKSRELLSEGLSELTLITMHHDVLKEICDSDSISSEKIQQASSYLREWIAPMHVKLQSYRAVINELHQKNDRLIEEIENRKKAQEELAKSKDYFLSLLENAQDIITVLDLSGIIRFDTPSVNRILGYKKNELVGISAFRLIHPDDLGQVLDTYREVKENPNHVVSTEFRMRDNKGRWVYLESIAKHVPESRDGAIIVINSRDISERKERERKLRESRAKLAEAQRIARVGSWEWRPGQKPELDWSEEMCRIYGLTPENFDHTYDSFIKHIHPDDRKRIENNIKKASKNKTSFSFEHKIIRPDGDVRVLHGRGQVETNEHGEIVKMFGTGQDVTEQKEKEKMLREYSNRLRDLSEEVERTREEERTRIAREIHDELGQMLTVLKMDVATMMMELKKEFSGETKAYFEKESQQILDRVSTIIDSIHRITTELRPEILDDLGLIAALQWQAQEFAKRTNLAIDFNTKLGKADFLSDQASTTLFRVFQESMSNVVRHSRATKVQIELEKRNRNLILSIKDNGIGFTKDQNEITSSFGIIGMRERTRYLGGDVYIEGKEGKGTRVTVRIPLDEENNTLQQ